MLKRILSLVLALVVILTLLAGCSSPKSTTTGTSVTGTSETGTSVTSTSGQELNKSYKIAHNKFGSGAYPLEIIVKESTAALKYFGSSLVVADNEFSVDKCLPDLQAQLANGVDGVEIFGVADTLFETMGDACTEVGVPFVLYDKTPTNTAIIEKLNKNKLFIGSISAEEYKAGFQMGQKAIADGNKTAVIIRAAIGDYSMDERDKGFSDAFAAGGGKVLGRAICANPTEAVTKAQDLFTAYPKADCLYGCGGDFGLGGVSALETRKDVNQNMKIYITDISPDLAQKLIDGDIDGVNGGQWVCAAIASTLLINYLDGHQILDENGKAPWLNNLQMVDLTVDKAQAYIDLMKADGSPLSESEYKSLLYRYNKDVSYQTYKDMLSKYAEIFMAKLG